PRIARPYATPGAPTFRALIAFYPRCEARYPGTPLPAPLRIHIGALDDWTPAAPCEMLTAILQRAGADARIAVYPDAHHGFDSTRQGPPIRPPNVSVYGVGRRGATVGPNPVAAQRATDDAFIEARVIHISPKVGGQVVEVNVTDNQRVRPGDVLVRIDPRDYEATAQQARAQVRAAEVEAQRARADARRVTELFARGLVARQELDHAIAAERTAEANLEAARQRLNEATLKLSYTTITAPEAGRVTRKAIEEGMFV